MLFGQSIAESMVVFMFIAVAVCRPLAPSDAADARTVTRDDAVATPWKVALNDSYLAVVFPWWSEIVIAALGCLATVFFQSHVWSRRRSPGYGHRSLNAHCVSNKDDVTPPCPPVPTAFVHAPADTSAHVPLVMPREVRQLVVTVKQGRAASLPDLLWQMVAVESVTCRHEHRASELLVNALRACAAFGQFHSSLKAYDAVSCHVGSGTICIWSLLLYAAAEAGEFNRCRPFYRKLVSIGAPMGHDVVNVVRGVVRQRDLAGLKSLLEDLVKRKRASPDIVIDGNTRNKALRACCHEGLPSFALVVASSDAFDEALDAVSYNTLMACYTKCREPRRCFDTYDEMRAKGIVPTSVTFGILFEACMHENDIDRAQALLSEVRTYGVELTAAHRTSFLRSLIANKRLDDAERMVQDMWQQEHAQPDIIDYAMLVRAHADKGDMASTLRIVEAMVEKGIDSDELIFNAVLTSCCKSPDADSDKVIAVFERLVVLGLKPSTITLSILLKAFANRNSFDNAMRMLEMAPDRFGMQVEVRLFIQLIQNCVKVGSRAQALQVHGRMVENAMRCGQVLDERVRKRLLRQCMFGATRAEGSK